MDEVAWTSISRGHRASRQADTNRTRHRHSTTTQDTAKPPHAQRDTDDNKTNQDKTVARHATNEVVRAHCNQTGG